jgi:tetratricopeptide (TPR) repeat protein
MYSLAHSYAVLDKFAEAHKLQEEALAFEKSKLGLDHPSTLGSMVLLAGSYRELGRNTDAAKLLEEALPLMKAKIPNHPSTYSCMTQLALCYRILGRAAEASTLHEDVVALRTAKLGPDHVGTLGSISMLARHYYHAAGERTDAFRVINDAIRQHPDTAMFYRDRAQFHCEDGHFQQAIPDFEKALEIGPVESWVWYKVATLCLYTGDIDRYRGACRELLEIADENSAYRINVDEQTAKVCALSRDSVADFSQVERLAQRCVTGTEEHQLRRWFVLAKALTDYRSADNEAAIAWLQRFAPKDDGTHSDASAFAVLAMAHHRLGHADQARASLDSARDNIAKKPPDWKRGTNWIDWLHCEILFREAVELLSVNEPKASEASSATTQ